MARKPMPLPEKLSWRDLLQVVFSFAMIPLGLIILYHTATKIRTVTGFLVGAAFVAFGSYRLYLAYTRYHQLLQNRSKNIK